MEWGWLQSLLYGLLWGVSEFLPVSAYTNQLLFQEIFGLDPPGALLSLAVCLGSLTALLVSCRRRLRRLRKERRIAAIPAKKRKRPPDAAAMLDMRLMSVALVPLALSVVAAWFLNGRTDRLWVGAILAAVNGVIVYFPQHLPQANKESRSLSALDSLLVGLAGALGAIPGISRMGAMTAAGRIRGMDRQYCLDFCLIVSIPVLAALCLVNGYGVWSSGSQALSGTAALQAIAACAAAFLTASAGIQGMRFLAVKSGFTGFAYYSWGASFMMLMLYLIV